MEKVVSRDGTLIAFDKSGNGPALVLVDGAFCYRKYGVTPDLAPLLSENFTVYSYDRRGRGDSTDTLPYSIDNEIEDLKCVIKNTNEEPYLCGFSSGAGLVIHAIGKGVRAKKIALFEPPYVVISPADTPPPEDAVTKLNKLVTEGKRGEAVKYFMNKIMGMPGIYVLLFKLFGKTMWIKNEGVAHTLSYDVEIMGDYLVPQHITSGIDIPALIIAGEKSPQNLRNAAGEVARSIPHSQIRLLKGQSHNINMKVLSPVLIDFFNS